MWLLGVVMMVDNADQSIVRGVATQVESTFHVHDFQISLLASAAVVLNALITMPAGYLADRWHRARSMAVTVALWSIVSTLGAFMPTFALLLVTRASLGFGQGITEPSANSLLSDYYERDGRGRAFSIQQALIFGGIALGTTVSGYVGQYFGWRYAYLVVSLPGLVVAYLVSRLYEPRRGESDSKTIGQEIENNEIPEKVRFFEFGIWEFIKSLTIGLKDDVLTILKIPTLRLTLVGVASILFTVSAIGFWLPVFYQRSYHMSQANAGLAFGLMLILGGIPGLVLGGRLADRLIAKYSTTRVVMPGICAFVATTIFLISFSSKLPFYPVVVLHLIGFLFGAAAVPALRAGLADVTPGHLRGAGFGAFNLTSVIFGSAAAPLIVGFLSQHYGGNLRTAFLIVLPPVYLGTIFLIAAKRHIEKDTMAIFNAIVNAVEKEKEERAKQAELD